MVIEDPTPRCVGLEFVRQYYTVLNKAPSCLHRFYSNDSKFLHSGEVVLGQTDIHQKILSLGFHDCHAKIQLVDAFETIGDGILIQVTGELSNGGMPLRKFTQSIVLAPQSAKKYYVHSDIFHYIDELFNEENEENATEDIEETEITSTVMDENFIGKTVNGNIHDQPDIPINDNMQATPESYCVPAVNQSGMPKNPPPSVSPIPHINPHHLSEDLIPNPINENSVHEDISNDAVCQEEWQSESPPLETSPVIVEEKPELAVMEEIPVPEPIVSNEPKTYANRLKNTSAFSSNYMSSPATNNYSEPAVPMTNHVSKTKTEPRYVSRPVSHDSTNGNQTHVKLATAKNFPDEDRRRFLMPDSHQIFVGNLPHNVSEEELKDAFRDFGKVIDIRINTAKGKVSAKGSSHSVPNFGFISFETEESVKKCLQVRPIYLNGESRINVEEKKTRTNGSNMPPRPTGRGGLRGSISQGVRDDETRRPQMMIPDSQQIFVGNLPPSISEEELKDTFQDFGKVIDIRINTAKGTISTDGSTHTVPNFGFVSFDNEDSVKKCLEVRPIYLNGESRINVEEKKTRTNGNNLPSKTGSRGVFRGPVSQGLRGGGIRANYNRENRSGRGGFSQRR